MSDRVEVQCGPADRDGKRTVLIMLGSRQYVDKIDVQDAFRRSKLCDKAIAKLRLDEGAIEYLDQTILDAATAEDANTVAAVLAVPNIINLATVKPKPISWHWDRTIPRGAITYIFGDAGEGKSQWGIDIVARRSLGMSMPPHELPTGEPPTTSLILTCEDDIERTVVPRLLAKGADMSRIISLSTVTPWDNATPRLVQLPTDLPMLRALIIEHKIDTVLVDVFTGFLAEGINPNSDSEMRACMAAIHTVAEATQSTWLLLGHPNKREGAKSAYRAGGSVAIVAASRAAFAIGQTPDDPTTKVFAPVKFNLGPRPHSLTFSIEAAGSVSRIVWGGQTDLTAADVLGSEAKSGGGNKLEAAKAIISDILADGPRGSSEVLGACEAAGIGERTYHSARKALGIKSERTGFGGDGQWLLTMPLIANGACHDF